MAQNYLDEVKKYQSAEQQSMGQDMQNPSHLISGLGAGVTTLSSFMTQVYSWMALGLVITGFVAYATFASGLLFSILSTGQAALIGLIIVEFALVIAFTAMVRKNVAAPILASMFLVYAAINGMTLSVLLLIYTGSSVVSTFFITAGVFGSMAIYGMVTKRDLSGMGQFMMMGLFGIIIASVVNIFVGSNAMSWGISLIAVVIFIGLTAWDVQKLKAYHAMAVNDESQLKRYALAGALTLYLDFVNLFIHLLRLTGKRK